MRQEDLGKAQPVKRYFRTSDRVLNLNGAWYFSTREGDMGPFISRPKAEAEIQRFLLERRQLEGFQAKRVDMLSRMQRSESARRGTRSLDQTVDSGSLALSLDRDLLL